MTVALIVIGVILVAVVAALVIAAFTTEDADAAVTVWSSAVAAF